MYILKTLCGQGCYSYFFLISFQVFIAVSLEK